MEKDSLRKGNSVKKMKNLSENKAIAYVIAGTALIAIGPFFVEFSGLSAMGSSFYRMLIGGIAFFLIGMYQKKPLPSIGLLWLYGTAAVTITVDLLLCNQSILYIGSGLATVLSNLEVIFLLLIGVIAFKEKVDKTLPTTILLISAGIYLLIKPYLHEMHSHLILGISYALLASFVFSIYLLSLKSISKKSPETSTAVNLGIICILGTVILGAVMYFLPGESFALPASWSGKACVAIYSLMSQVCGWWLISQGLSKLNLSTSGVLFLMQPALTYLGDCLFLGRNTGLFQIAGCAILLATIYKTVQEKEKREATA